MRYFPFVFLFLFIFCLPAGSQEVEIKRVRTFTGTALYGFMNGGADLFFEFGVEELTNYDIEYKGEEFTVDVYKMPTPEDAFGIYSMHVFRCEWVDTFGFINCLSSYQHQSVIGNLYVSIVFPSGSSAAKSMVSDLLKYFLSLDTVNHQRPSFPSFPGIDSVYSGQVKFVRGPLSALNASVGMYNLVKDNIFARAWFTAKGDEDAFFTRVYFESAADKEAFKEKLTTGKLLEENELSLYIEAEEPIEEDNDAGPFGF